MIRELVAGAPRLAKPGSRNRTALVGIVQHDTRRILFKAFCQPPDDWQREPMIAIYGGDCYFQAQFDPARKALEKLVVNRER